MHAECENHAVTCSVCGSVMERWPIEPNSRVDEVWSCTWCFATISRGGEAGFCRPLYRPVHMRWERAVAAELDESVDHAYGLFRTTLCAIELADLEPSPHPWPHRRETACDACCEAAETIDARWPVSKRGTHARALPDPFDMPF